ncbi:MAG: ATP-binding protein [Candidatus Altiarchaeota archaeon]|nr:ATP-binding protein [Candidatus Altiarchaeota archaeon]
MAVKQKHAGGMPDPEKLASVNETIPVNLDDRRSSMAEGVKVIEKIVKAMESKNFGSAETFAVHLALEELATNAVNYCETPNVSVKAQVDSTRTTVELRWNQSREVKLEELAEERTREVNRMARSKKKYGKHLEDRVEAKSEAGELGGAGLGLMLVKSYVDEFTTRFDKTRKEMVAVIVKKRKVE